MIPEVGFTPDRTADDPDLFGALGDTMFEIGAEGQNDPFGGIVRLTGGGPPPDSERTRAAVTAVRAGKGAQKLEYAVQTPAGRKHFEARVAAATHRRSILMVVRDISVWTDERNRLLESETRFRIMADHAPVLLWMAGTDGRCDFFNQVWLDFTGRPFARELGSGWAEGIHFEDFQNSMHLYYESFVERRPFRLEYRLRRADGEYRWILDQGVPRYGPEGEFEGYIGSCIDITPLKMAQEAMLRFNAELEERVRQRTAELDAAVAEKEVLLREIHHRVKNNLQVISSLLNLQARHLTRYGAPDVQQVREALVDCQGRVRSIGLVHEKLYQTEDLSRVDFGNYLTALVGMILSAADAAPVVQVDVNIENVRLGVDQAIPCGLLVHELLTNALKHAFPHGRGGKVRLELRRFAPGQLRLAVEDDGVGIPPTVDLARPPSLGLELVKTLARQMRADLRVDRSRGTAFGLVFPAGD